MSKKKYEYVDIEISYHDFLYDYCLKPMSKITKQLANEHVAYFNPNKPLEGQDPLINKANNFLAEMEEMKEKVNFLIEKKSKNEPITGKKKELIPSPEKEKEGELEDKQLSFI